MPAPGPELGPDHPLETHRNPPGRKNEFQKDGIYHFNPEEHQEASLWNPVMAIIAALIMIKFFVWIAS